VPKGIGHDRRAVLAGLLALATAGEAVAQTPQSLAVTPIHPDAQSEEAALMRQKIERAGYTDVGALARDSTGTWRGRAKRGDRPVEVVVDKGGRIKAEQR
jgi:putative membrane protein